MKPIAVFYHCRVSANGDAPIPFEHGISVVARQVIALRDSGLAEAASEMFIGVNGGEEDTMAVSSLAPEKAKVIQHPDGSKGEHPTLHALQKWLPEHRGWHVIYFHTKGATKPGNAFWDQWRDCMMKHCVWNWQQCVLDLEMGFDTAGVHYLVPEKYPGSVLSPFYGGNFWWAKSDYLLTLPPIAPSAVDRPSFYDAESWIGRGPRRPNARCYGSHWPNPTDCHA